MSSPALLEARGLSFRYGRVRILEGVDLALREGELLGILGPNGSGKSTLLGILSGWLRPAEGSVRVLGRPLSSLRAPERARLLAHVAQRLDPQFPFTVREYVAFGRYAHGDRGGEPGGPVDRALAALELQDLASRPLTRLSGGEIQRAHLARACAAEPAVYLLDEPTASLDPGHQVRALARIRERLTPGHAAIAVLHDLNLAAATCDRVALLHQGRVVAEGRASSVLEEARLRAVYGPELRVIRGPAGEPVVLAGSPPGLTAPVNSVEP